jgi:hypothetical protein
MFDVKGSETIRKFGSLLFRLGNYRLDVIPEICEKVLNKAEINREADE